MAIHHTATACAIPAARHGGPAAAIACDLAGRDARLAPAALTAQPRDRHRLAAARRSWCGIWLGCALTTRRGDPGCPLPGAGGLDSADSAPVNPLAALAALVIDVLAEFGQIEQQVLARRMAAWCDTAPQGPGVPGMVRVLARVARGEHWSRASRAVYAGRGCIDAGAAARSAPVGVWFADDLAAAASQACRAAEITHAHPEGQAAAVAVAVAAGWYASQGSGGSALIDAVLDLMPASRTRHALAGIASLSGGIPLARVAAGLRGLDIAPAMRAAPLAVWCAAHSEQPLLELMQLSDTSELRGAEMLAMVGGILAGTPFH